MRVLVTAASRYGATREIATAVAATLRTAGLDVTVAGIERAGPADRYDAVVLGSAVYMGQWLKPARVYVAANGAALRARPVWLFSSGPIGDPPAPDPDALEIAAILLAAAPVEHRVFGGRIDRSKLHLADRAVVGALRAPDADNRPWDEIEAWARTIATTLATTTTPG